VQCLSPDFHSFVEFSVNQIFLQLILLVQYFIEFLALLFPNQFPFELLFNFSLQCRFRSNHLFFLFFLNYSQGDTSQENSAIHGSRVPQMLRGPWLGRRLMYQDRIRAFA